MKSAIERLSYSLTAALMTVVSMFVSVLAFAQDQGGIDVDVTTRSSPAWYGNWGIWVGVAVFLIVVVALTSRGRRA